MAQTIKLKRSAVANNIPTTIQLELGEIAINTYDGKMFIKKDDGVTQTIVEVGAGSSSITPKIDEYNPSNFTAGTTTTLTLTQTPISIDALQIFFNGVYRHKSDITSLVGNVVTFVDPIPVGTTIIDVHYFY